MRMNSTNPDKSDFASLPAPPNRKSRWFTAALVGVTMMAGTSAGALADHQWSSYHWNRDGVAVLQLNIGDNHDTVGWSSMLDQAVADWNAFSGAYLEFAAVSGGSGDIESYNDNYGDTGWLGLASISVQRGKNKHIVSGSSKVNEYYITLSGYDGFDQSIEQQHVMCQEIGHTFGLDHNREGAVGGSPDDTCMNDETRPLRYPAPNSHDDELLNDMYGHDHGSDGGGGKEPKCHPVFGCPAVANVTWAEHYDDHADMFDAADAVVNATVLSSGFHRNVGRGAASVPVTRVMLRVTETLKGAARGVVVIEQTRGPGLEIRDDPGYVSGDNYTLYLRQTGGNTYRTVNPFGRIKL